MAAMGFSIPMSLSPSRVDAFTSCPLQFRFASIEKLPEPPSVPASKGSLVHRALELLFCLPPVERTPEAGQACLVQAVAELRLTEEFALLALEPEDEERFVHEAEGLVTKYFEMEDPTVVREIGIELRLEVEVAGLTLRGIIDRLELDEAGGLVVTDYKTGRPPRVDREQGRLGGVHFYSFLCEQLFGRRPARIQLMYLSTGEVIETTPTDNSSRFLPRRTDAVWQAVRRACASGEFKPRPGNLCSYCAFQPWCPSFGGDPERARIEAPVRFGLAADRPEQGMLDLSGVA
jgi:putative RecB family exonuclease